MAPNVESADVEAEVSEALKHLMQLKHVSFMIAAHEQYVIYIGEDTDILLFTVC